MSKLKKACGLLLAGTTAFFAFVGVGHHKEIEERKRREKEIQRTDEKTEDK